MAPLTTVKKICHSLMDPELHTLKTGLDFHS